MFLDSPRFVMEVLSPSTEKYDRTEKMDIYRQQEIDEYWIVDWRERKVEIYTLDYDKEIPKYYLWKTITRSNKDALKMIHFPNVKITFDELFEELDMWHNFVIIIACRVGIFLSGYAGQEASELVIDKISLCRYTWSCNQKPRLERRTAMMYFYFTAMNRIAADNRERIALTEYYR